MKRNTGAIAGLLVILAAALLPLATSGCLISVRSDDDDQEHDWNDSSGDTGWDDNYGDTEDSDPINEAGCYADTTVGCTHLTWSDVEWAVDLLYLFRDTYNGYTKEEALALAKVVYDNGVYPEEYLEIIDVQELEGGRYRAFVVATGYDGYPLTDLGIRDFELEIDAADPQPPARVRRLAELSDDEVRADISVVIDDSGSVRDCDANFITQGLSHLFESLPPIYRAELIKFENDVYLANDWTDAGDELAEAMRTYCTDRGATSLWDAVYRGIQDMPTDGDLRAVVVFTDGLDNDSSQSYSSVVEEAERRGVPVLVAALGTADILTLSRLAGNTGGAFVYIPSGEEILDAFETLTSFVTNTYVVEWETQTVPDSVKIRSRMENEDTIADTFYWE